MPTRLLVLLLTIFFIGGNIHTANAIANSTFHELHHKKNDKPTLGQLRRKYADTFLVQGPHVKQVALTFDDVPDIRFTPQVLDVLKSYNVKATFFVVGERAEKHPNLVKRMVKEGHIVGNHSYNHALLTKLSLHDFQRQLLRTDRIMSTITGHKPKFIRPPYGEINEEQLQWLKQNGFIVVNWNVDSLDWKGIDKQKVERNIVRAVRPGSIILQHAGGGTTSDLTGSIEALPNVIMKLKGMGYRFVTLPELLDIEPNRS
ncbi:polysaccharide deacetylase family protein [Paenibacillus sediminis]|uniref:Peptidoglycan/xylan/chitin deacetylase (PgdA/CDA1 family) n=1 Tax=Paenibacillus sediminis TaxID=664909 RepID=A0ABS4H0A5_9BACL|nr:polysaccharide deacetylase family protein [Paenibacillus sediminis]MBP1935958.1 peptidoglycan/xylan/chitin deacetylase (PgdA/CDA1 family) [Paenibacillus sediminis]